MPPTTAELVLSPPLRKCGAHPRVHTCCSHHTTGRWWQGQQQLGLTLQIRHRWALGAGVLHLAGVPI
jgi:hypothetical protein